MKARDLEALMILAAVGGGAYIAYKAIKTAMNPNAGTPYEGGGLPGTVANVLNQASGGLLAAGGSAIGTTLYDWVNPKAGGDLTSTDYIVTFPDGARHAVNSAIVDDQNNFLYGSRVYTIKVDASNRMFAV